MFAKVMALPQRDSFIEEIKRTDTLLEYAVMHGEGEIDQLVYKLYGLTDDEIKVVEKAVKK